MNPKIDTKQTGTTAASENSTTASAAAEKHTLQEPAAKPQKNPLSAASVRITIIPEASRLEQAVKDAKKYPEPCKRWDSREELINKQSFELSLGEYRSAKILSIALNCSEYMIYRAFRHHGITRPRAYLSPQTKELLRL